MDMANPDVSCVVIRLVSLNIGLKDFFEEVRSRNERNVVQLFDPEMIVNGVHVFGAYLNARQSFREGSNISKSPGTEMLLFAAMTRQIGDAIKLVGVKTNENALLFATKQGYGGIKKYIKYGKAFSPSKKHKAEAAMRLGIDIKLDLDIAVLNRMSSVRLSD